MRILVANIFGIGDVLFTTPLVRNLKRHFGDVSIDYLCNARAKNAIENVPEVDRYFIYEKDDFVKLWRESKIRFFREYTKQFSLMRKRKYDIVFDFTLSRYFGFLYLLLGIPKRVGFDYKRRGIFLNYKVPLKSFKGRHVIEWYLELLRKMEIPVVEKRMRLVLKPGELEWASGYLKDKNVQNNVVAVVPGGGASWGRQAPRKRWMTSGFAALSDKLSGQGYSVLILGDRSEKVLCKEVASQMMGKKPVVECDLTLNQYMALLSKCELVVCHDCGPLHIATALGVKTVSIFGPGDKVVYGPYPASDKSRVVEAENIPCRPCYSSFKLPDCKLEMKCLRDITPDDVLIACIDLLRVV
ncbi:MAG: glycosyltransferase family 9 protein [Candidatus Omnitrophica bacterium]|nr:glycosyltransferase family 9 protein [Candidatus Omnitrophota bacterium]